MDCAEAVDHALRTKLLAPVLKLDGVAGDNGGGDSGEPLWTKIKILQRTKEEYVCANCNLHKEALLMSAIIQVVGAGAIQNRTFLQKAHDHKDIQDAHERLEWKGIVKAEILLELAIDLTAEDIDVHELLMDKKGVKAQGNPVTTRWNEVGPAAKRGQVEGGLYARIAKGGMQQDPTRKAANKIASGLYLLEREYVLKANERLLLGLNCHDMIDSWSYKAFQVWGPHSKKSGFSAESVLCIACL